MYDNPTTVDEQVTAAIECATVPESPQTVALIQKLEDCRITPDTAVRKQRFLFRMMGIPCFPRGELVALTGKKKSGKTILVSLCIALCSLEKVLSMSRLEANQLHALWIDTEQSDESTQDILVNRIAPILNNGLKGEEVNGSNTSYIDVFNLRCVSWTERMRLIETAIRRNKPDLVVFDGIRDVVDDINDSVQAQSVVERLMLLAQEFNCCIICVLHQNKSLEDKTLRGALGTELGNKCFEEYECTKDSEHRFFTCRQTATRKYDISSDLVYTLDSNGLPVLMTAEQVEALTAVTHPQPQPVNAERKLNPAYMKDGDILFQKAYCEVLADGAELRSVVLRQRFMDLVGIKSERWYGRCLSRAIECGLLIRNEMSPQYVTYRLAPQTLFPTT